MKLTKLFLALACALSTAPAHAVLFSIDATSPSTVAISPADVLSPGPVGGPPVVAIPFGATGLKLLPGDDVSAIAFPVHTEPAPVFFSVDRLALGAPSPAPSVITEAAVGQAAGDIYIPPVAFTNTLVINQSALGLLPPAVPGVPVPPPIDNVDALEMIHPAMPSAAGLLYALAPGSPTLGAIGATAGDILTTTASGPIIAIPFASMGLVPADVVDGLVVLAGTPAVVFFSLAPGSPSLVAPLTAGDVLIPGPTTFVSAPMLGLVPPGDNVDAISAVPEAHRFVLMLAGLGALLIALRMQRR